MQHKICHAIWIYDDIGGPGHTLGMHGEMLYVAEKKHSAVGRHLSIVLVVVTALRGNEGMNPFDHCGVKSDHL